MTKPPTEVAGVEEVARLYSIVSKNHGNRTPENMSAWNEAYTAAFQAATTLEDLEKLLSVSTIYCGLAAGSIHAVSFTELQNRVAALLQEKIAGCKTVKDIQSVFGRLVHCKSAGVHIHSGPDPLKAAIRITCLKWYDLCATKEELVRMMKETRNEADVYDII